MESYEYLSIRDHAFVSTAKQISESMFKNICGHAVLTIRKDIKDVVDFEVNGKKIKMYASSNSIENSPKLKRLFNYAGVITMDLDKIAKGPIDYIIFMLKINNELNVEEYVKLVFTADELKTLTEPVKQTDSNKMLRVKIDKKDRIVFNVSGKTYRQITRYRDDLLKRVCS